MANPASVRQIIFGEPNGCQIHDSRAKNKQNLHSILLPYVLIVGTVVGTKVCIHITYSRLPPVFLFIYFLLSRGTGLHLTSLPVWLPD